MIKDKSIQVFLDELAGKSSTPGGGSAAAIIGAMGAALISMVANFTVGKKGYESVDAEARDILGKAESLRDQLTGMIKADVDVFNRVMAAYGMPKETDEQKSARSAEIQSASPGFDRSDSPGLFLFESECVAQYFPVQGFLIEKPFQ